MEGKKVRLISEEIRYDKSRHCACVLDLESLQSIVNFWGHGIMENSVTKRFGCIRHSALSIFSHVYFGEYPLSFAACLGQEECVRLLIAKGANPNLQDSNGNTVMHMMVIHDKKVCLLV